MRMITAIVFTCVLASVAHADKPTLDEVKQAVRQLEGDVLAGSGTKPPNATRALEAMTETFWYDGFDFY